jgi:hypothetical protein
MDEYTDRFNENKSKDTNPKDALGIAKTPMHCVSARVLMELGLAMMEGGRKYGTHNYRAMGVRGSVYYDATMRHMMAWWEGQDTDPDSGVSHIVKAIAGLVVMRDSMLMQNFEDDRPIRLPDQLNIDDLNEQAKAIIEKYPDPKQPFIHAGPEKMREEEPKLCTQTRRDRAVCRCASCIGIRRIEQKEGLGRVGEPWGTFEETYLRYMVKSKRPIAEIAKMHQRTNGAIRSRMDHLGIDFRIEVKHEEGKIAHDDVVDGYYYNANELCKCSRCKARRELH